MNKRQKRKVILVFLCIALWISYESWPILQSEAKVRQKMFKKFPLGTQRDVVWRYAKEVDPGVYGASTGKFGWWKNNDRSSKERVGKSRVRATVSTMPPMSVDVIWLFDENDQLIEIYAWKTIDLL
eukprot:COSAG01_NODE_313_length_19043_cov_3.917177_7_plen_126_part_00